MGGRHRRGVSGGKRQRGAVVGSSGAVLLLCGALVYGVGVMDREPVDPDPPVRTRAATPSLSAPPAGTPTLAMPVEASPGANMKRRPVVRQTQARPTVPSTTRTTAPPARKTAATKPRRSPTMWRSGGCVYYRHNGVRYRYCPDRTETRRPRR